MKESPVATFRREKDLVLYLGNRKKRVKILILLGILSVLVQSALSSLFELLSHLSLVHFHQVLLLEVDRCQKGARTTSNSILVLVVHHKCVFIIDRSIMSRGLSIVE